MPRCSIEACNGAGHADVTVSVRKWEHLIRCQSNPVLRYRRGSMLVAAQPRCRTAMPFAAKVVALGAPPLLTLKAAQGVSDPVDRLPLIAMAPSDWVIIESSINVPPPNTEIATPGATLKSPRPQSAPVLLLSEQNYLSTTIVSAAIGICRTGPSGRCNVRLPLLSCCYSNHGKSWRADWCQILGTSQFMTPVPLLWPLIIGSLNNDSTCRTADNV